ncbi:metal-dependent hydrolase [Janthinobacterium sp. RB2R34]
MITSKKLVLLDWHYCHGRFQPIFYGDRYDHLTALTRQLILPGSFDIAISCGHLMPSIISHAVVPLAAGLALGSKTIPPQLLLLGMAVAMLPDADVLGFHLGVPYAHYLGHRGITHSLLFALLLGVLAWTFARQLRASRQHAFFFILFATASHPLLDMLTNGGLGVALFWPISDERLFFPLRVIEVSPLSIRRFFSGAGVRVLLSEIQWIWIPSAILAAVIVCWRRMARVPAQGL